MKSLAATLGLLVFPGAFLIAVGAGRHLQPRRFEPAHTLWIIFEWASRMGRPGALLLFLLLPALAVAIGFIALMRSWRVDSSLRSDPMAAAVLLQRPWAPLFVACASIAGAAIFIMALAHILRD